jgi:hypothetical protein
MPNTTVGLYELQTRMQFQNAYQILMLFYTKTISRRILTNLGVPFDVAMKVCKGNKRSVGSHYKAEEIPDDVLRLISAFLNELREAKRADLALGNKKKGKQPQGKGVHYISLNK